VAGRSDGHLEVQAIAIAADAMTPRWACKTSLIDHGDRCGRVAAASLFRRWQLQKKCRDIADEWWEF